MNSQLVFIIPSIGGLSIFLFALSLIPHKSPLTVTLEDIAGRNLQGPNINRLATLEKLFGDEGRGELQRQLIEAGWYTVTPAQMGARLAAGATGGLATGILFMLLLHQLSLLFAMVTFVLTIVGAYAPLFALNRASDARKVAVQRALPDFLDMVSTTVQAGLSVNAALNYAVAAVPGPLGDEMKEALSQMRLGRSRIEALKAMTQRVNQPQLTTTVTAITQAERLGSNLSGVLDELAEDVRNHRIMLVEEQAAKLPIKMIFPMAFFLLPALFSIIFGAVAVKLLTQH
ncbi:MAG: type II secretion system F family protein [Candidatus Baltobacteraceae bacterium]